MRGLFDEFFLGFFWGFVGERSSNFPARISRNPSPLLLRKIEKSETLPISNKNQAKPKKFP
jgi:hypothetical protein